jgi:2'-5' RNA ligase
MRAFIAIELPESIRTQLGELNSRLRSTRVKASWVQPDRMHLTLRFLGDITDEQAETLSSLITQACSDVPGFTLTCGGLGAFPNLRRPSVVWAGIGPLEPDLVRVQAASESAARSCGLSAETKPFHPHVTLARIKDPRNAAALVDAIHATSAFDAGAFDVSHVSLFSSELTPRGAIYTRIREFPMKRDKS